MSQAQVSKYTVKARYLIRGPNREKFQHYFVAGRGWTKDWLEVGVVAGEDDPVEEYTDNSSGSPQKRLRPVLNLVNEAQLAEILKDDINMAVRPIDQSGEAKDMKVDVLGMMKDNEELKAELTKQKAEVDRLRTKLDEANKFLEEATKPAAELAAKVARNKASAKG
jgi:hypothetical protein